MLGKSMRMGVLLGTAVGAPFVWHHAPRSEDLQHNVQGWLDQAGSTSRSWLTGHGDGPQEVPITSRLPMAGTAGPGNLPQIATPTLTGPATSDLETVLRFDVTPRWVTEHWSRVSTVRAEQGWEGLRVPVVTGTQFDDLAGSLTYYFDGQHQLRRITLHGVTGDERKLVDFVSRVYQLEPDPQLAGSIHVARWNGRPVNVLRVALAPVIRANMPHSRLEILLELNRPGDGFQLSAQSASIVQQHRTNRAW